MSFRERRVSAVMNSMPSWREKRLLSEDDNLHPFCWTYGTGELIDELARIDEILNLSEVLQQPTDMPDHFGIDICFEESFIDSHEMLVMLLDRVTAYWNTHGQQDVLKIHKNKSSDNLIDLDTDKQKTYWTDLMVASYKHANTVYKHMRDSLLRMRFLYEQLKPETQALVKCCSYKIQLQNSMLAQKIVRVASNPKHTFQPACGFKLDCAVQVHKKLPDIIADVDMKMALMKQLKDEQVVRDALEVCDVLRNIVEEGSRIQDHMEAWKYSIEIIAPKKHILERYSSCFENTLQTFPNSYPSTCTQEEASYFFMHMLEALDKDTKHLEMLKKLV